MGLNKIIKGVIKITVRVMTKTNRLAMKRGKEAMVKVMTAMNCEGGNL